MTGKKRKDADKAENNINDADAQFLVNLGHLTAVKVLLAEKPHLCAQKHSLIDDAVRELDPYLKNLVEHLLKTENTDELEHNVKIIFSILALVKAINNFGSYQDVSNLLTIACSLSNLLCSDKVCAKLKAEIGSFCERFLDEVDKSDERRKFDMVKNTFTYFLDLTLVVNVDGKTVKKSDVKRVYAKRKCVDTLDIHDPSCKDLLSKLKSTVTHPEYFKCKEGEHFIGHLLRRDTSLAKEIHNIIMNHLPNVPKPMAYSYGAIYFLAWNLAEEDEQKVVENCIQDVMIKCISMPRCGYDMSKAGTNVFTVLSVLHKNRTRKSFSGILNDLYTGVLWRALKSEDPFKRCNAAAVFLDVFPLEKPYSTAADNADYIEHQIGHIKGLLLDESHFVRVTCIKGTCAVLATSIQLFGREQIKDVCYILFECLPFDESSHMVRKTVFEGLELIISNINEEKEQDKASVIETLLKCLVCCFYDEVEKVRKAFVKMLIKLKEKRSVVNVLYWDVIPVEQILQQLALEGPEVGELIAKLIMFDVYIKKTDMNKTISRFCRILDWSPEGTKNLFRYSSKVLCVKEAYSIIITLIGTLRKNLKDYLNYMNRENNADHSKSSNRKPNGKGTLKDISNKTLEMEISADSDTSVSSSATQTPLRKEFFLLGKHKQVTGLIQVSTIIWTVFGNALNKETDLLDNLHALSCNAIPMFLKHYKDTPVYYATVSFASLVPIGKLRPVSTISSACISELKQVTDTTDPAKLECLIYALCAWSRGNDVLDLASEWLNFAFREQNLNNTAFPKAGQKRMKVRFLQKDGKPLLGLQLLDILFADILNEKRVFSKNYEQMYDLYICMEKITIILERKMADPESFNKPSTSLTDDFIYRTYFRYLRLMHSLHRININENVTDSVPPFDSAVAFTNALEFASKTLFPSIPQDPSGELNLAAKCCLTVLDEATSSLILGRTNVLHCRALCLFAQDLISLDSAIWYLSSVVNTINEVAEHVLHYMPQDRLPFLSTILPALHSKALNVIIQTEITATSALTILKDISKFRSSLFGLNKVLIQCYGTENKLFIESVRDFIKTCILLEEQYIINEDIFEVYRKIDYHPFFVSLILKNLLLKPSLFPMIIPTLEYHLEKFSEEGYKLLGCVSILYTLILAQKKRFKREVCEKALQNCYEVVMAYKPKEKKPSDNDDLESSSIESIDVKKAASPVFDELSEFLCCSLHKY